MHPPLNLFITLGLTNRQVTSTTLRVIGGTPTMQHWLALDGLRSALALWYHKAGELLVQNRLQLPMQHWAGDAKCKVLFGTRQWVGVICWVTMKVSPHCACFLGNNVGCDIVPNF
jgi:hypothetical protein